MPHGTTVEWKATHDTKKIVCCLKKDFDFIYSIFYINDLITLITTQEQLHEGSYK